MPVVSIQSQSGTRETKTVSASLILPAATPSATATYCYRYPDTLESECLPLPCDPPYVADASGECGLPCTLDCTGAGYTGRVWPFSTAEGDCVCETEEGYFIEAGATGGAVACDADGDGWVKRSATEDAIESDEALWQNRRCHIQTVGRIALRDEYGVALTVRSCTNGLVILDEPCTEELPIRLLETSRNDVQSQVEQSSGVPEFGVDGRQPRANELNALTKACNRVVRDADYDDDGNSDHDQGQAPRDSFAGNDDDQARLASFSYYVELYSAFYQAPDETTLHGTLVVQERSRCSAEFPLLYSSADTAGNTTYDVTKATYWRNCQRRRDASYSASSANFDFAQWSDAITEMPGPATATDLGWDIWTRPDGGLPDYGLCALNGEPPADGKWRGLNHHSQFKCELVSDIADYSGGKYAAFNVCAAKTCGPTDPDCEESRPIGDSGAFEPIVECELTPATVGAVGWGLVGYQPYGSVVWNSDGTLGTYQSSPPVSSELPVVYDTSAAYSLGCINEDIEWGAKLCPDAETPMASVSSTFGRVSCAGNFLGYVWHTDANLVSTSSDDYSSNLVWNVGLWQ